MTDDPEYIYVKGQGWVPVRVGPVPKHYDHTDLSLWKTGDGRVMRVVDMGDGHVRNARNLLQRRYNELVFHRIVACFGCVTCTKLDMIERRIQGFNEELLRRGLAL